MKWEQYEFILLHNTWKTDQMEKREIDIDIWEEREWSWWLILHWKKGYDVI